MSHNLRISDGTNTVYLSEDDLYISNYVPQVAVENAPLRESVSIGFTRTPDVIRDKINQINRLFRQAENYQRSRTGKRVYVEFDPDDKSDYFRSELYSGKVEFPNDLLGTAWGAAHIVCDVEWTRQPFWEGALTQIPLSNTSSTNNLSGITVDNVNDATGENWVSIYGVNVEGDLPADIKLQMYNATTDATATDEIYVFHNVYSEPLNFVHIIEGENAVNSTDTVTSTTDATASSLAYAAITWSSTSETKIAEWTLASSDLSDAQGGRFAVVARWAGQFNYSDVWLRLMLETTTTYNDIWTGNLSLVSTTTDGDELTLLDTLRLPPYLEGLTTIKELALRLYGLKGTSGSYTINLDYLQLSSISNDAGWLHFKSVGAGVPAEQTFIHDATEGFTYYSDASSKYIAEFTQYGGPILLIPNQDQRLYFLTSDNTGAAKVSQDWTVKVWYRPRRSSL